jgi:hypothetical protein
MIKPEREYQWTLKDFLTNKQFAAIFFNSLLNIHKFIAYETKDPYFSKNDLEKSSDLSDWDRFVFIEYNKLTAEDEDQEDVI